MSDTFENSVRQAIANIELEGLTISDELRARIKEVLETGEIPEDLMELLKE